MAVAGESGLAGIGNGVGGGLSEEERSTTVDLVAMGFSRSEV